jgi:glycosyltransferase involved in cell wall biosynthesis
VAVELSGHADEYLYGSDESGRRFPCVTLFPDQDSRWVATRELVTRVGRALADVQPRVVALAGWSDRDVLAGLQWCRQARVPVVVMSESRALDGPRPWWKEVIKRRVVRGFAAGLVGGRSHAEYLASLGMGRERIFPGYDVVDNDHFARAAESTRQDAAAERHRLGLPESYFLASSRFIAKKNLPTLLQAYALYRRKARREAWKLVLLGDGPTRDEVLATRSRLGLDEDVLLPGMTAYEALPAYYGLAGAFVHASVTEQWGLVVNEAMAAGLPVLVSDCCGCAQELVVSGSNGYTFDPLQAEQLAGHLVKMADGEYDRHTMGRASAEIINRWSPQTFAVNLWKAAEAALAQPARARRLSDGLLLRLLIRRTRRLIAAGASVTAGPNAP